MGPSILQTLLREPTRSYQDIYDPNRPSSPSSPRRASSSGFSSPSSSRPSSIRSSGSAGSGGGPAWVNGQWEWSTFQGRKGLTGGTRSLYTPSAVGRSLGLGAGSQQQQQLRGTASLRSAGASAYDGSDDGRSLRSATSAGGESVRTSLSAPGGERRKTKQKKVKAREASEEVAGSGYDRAARTRSLSASASASALELRRGSASRFEKSPPLPTSFSARFGAGGGSDQPSRRYSSATTSAASPSFPTSPNLSAVSSRSRSSKSPLPLRHLSSDDTTPSLTSSSSSALSSEPRTPVQVRAEEILAALPLEGEKPRKVKKKRSSRLVPVEMVSPVEVAEVPVAQLSEEVAAAPVEIPPADAPPSPVPVPGRFYSVDEIFGSPASPEAAPSSPPAPHPLAGLPLPLPSPFLAASPTPPPLSRQESDNASFVTALDGAPPLAPAVPRLKLTRTESEQSRIGVRGSVELEVESEMGESPVREEPVRRVGRMEEVEEEEEEEEQQQEDEETSDSEVEEAVTPPQPAPAVASQVVHEDSQATDTTSFVAPAPAAEPEAPVLARFVEVKRSRSKRSNKSSSTDKPASPARAPAHESMYEVVRSSRAPRPASTSSISSLDPHLRSSSPTFSDFSASSASSQPAATDVPEWLSRIRALGEPIQPLVVNPAPQPKRQLAPPPHWTVQQLRAQEGSSSSSGSSSGGSNRPVMPRPRSVKSLRSRAKVLEGLPEDAEAEAEAAAADEQDRNAAGRTASPAWVRKSGVSPAASVRTASPAAGAMSRSSSLANSTSGSTSSGASTPHSTSRRSRSTELDRERLQPLSPLSRSTSLTTSRPASSRSTSRSAFEFDFEAIAAAAARPKGFSKFLQPPLASSKAVREQPPVAVVNPRMASPLRTTSLRAPSPEPRRSHDDDDARSESGLSDISIMSAPQLSPVRPPRNPARGASGSPQRLAAPAFSSHPPSRSSRDRSQSPAGSIRSNIERPAPAFETFERPAPRPVSTSFSAVERPILQRPVVAPPPVAPPITTAPPSISADSSRAASPEPRARPLSSYLPPSASGPGLTSLAVARRFDTAKQKPSRRFGLFRRSSDADLASSSKRRFEPSLDLAYDSLDLAMFRKRLRGDEVLIEVVAAGVDRWDRERVWQLARGTSGAGWVPGRAVVGKVLDAGEAASKVKKGELVCGLSPLRKSGGLASLAILSRDHVSAAPTSLTPELSAALPAPATSAMLIMQSLCDSLPKGSKVLVLAAHSGVGLLCLQLARHYRPGVSGSRDLWMVAQCPMSVPDGETRLREAGATDVLREEPLAAINGLHEGSFDVVIDTIGGRRLYDASRRILHNSGRFITTVGDDRSGSDYNSSLRSLRRAFVRKDKKQIAYWRVDPDGDGREAVRDTLDRVREVVDAGALKPRVESVLPLGEARRTFDEREAELEGVVVRVKEV
ncbi:hypothetical protein JCM10450v2_001073 [Rhodotorula kratochvilovae]